MGEKNVAKAKLSFQNEKDSSGIYGTNLKVCVAVGKKLLVVVIFVLFFFFYFLTTLQSCIS
jgi:hypothetical protein